MKKQNIILYIINFILIGFIIISNKVFILNNNRIILKNMSESIQVNELNKTIETLNNSHTEYASYIQTAKQKIVNAINIHQNVNATEKDSFLDLAEMITNMTNTVSNSYAVISSSAVHGSFARTTGDTNNDEYFNISQLGTQSEGNYTGTNTITIKKACKVKIIFMMTGGSAPDSFIVNIDGTPTIYTNTYGVLNKNTVEMREGSSVSLTANCASGAYVGGTLLLIIE